MLRDLILALSLANLCYMAAWSKLIAQSWNPLAQFTRYNLSEYQAILINVPLLAAVFWAGMTLVRRSGSVAALRLAEWAFLLVLIVPISGVLRTQFPEFSLDRAPNPLQSTGGVVWLAVAPLGASLLVRFRPMMVRLLRTILLVMSPFVLMTFAQAALLMTQFQDRPPADPLPAGRSGPRVLWLVFDEMDEGLAFTRRPPTVRLPELDRLRAESLWAVNALPPSGWTLFSMPALITGKLVAGAKVVNPSELALTFAGSEETRAVERPAQRLLEGAGGGEQHGALRLVPPLLPDHRPHADEVHEPGLASNPLGGHAGADSQRDRQPPARLQPDRVGAAWQKRSVPDARLEIPGDAGGCTRVGRGPGPGAGLCSLGVPPLPDHLRSTPGDPGAEHTEQLFRQPGAGGSDPRASYAARWSRRARGIRRSSSSPRITRSGEGTSSPTVRNGLRKRMRPSARRPDPEVPFILKLSGQEDGVRYEPSFNTVLTHDLVLALLRREVSSPASVVAWLDLHRSIDP